MGKNQSASNLTNIIKQDASGNITFVSGSTTLMSVSSSGAITTTGVISGSNALSASYALSASNATNAVTASFANAFTVANTLTATTLVVQTVTSSVIYSSGSNVFGNNIANTQTFTGSMNLTGSLTVVTNGTEFQVTSTGVKFGNVIGDAHNITGSVSVSGSLTGSSANFSGFLGINGSPGTAFPLEVYINSSTAYSSTSRGNVMRLYNPNSSSNVFAGIELGGAGPSNDGLAGINAVVTAAGSAALTFYTRDSNTFGEKMRITSGGNVGIGTTSTGFNTAGLPLVVGSGVGNTGLTIFSGASYAGSIHFADTETTGDGSYAGFINYDHTGNSMQFGTTGPTPANRMIITGPGYITTPAQPAFYAYATGGTSTTTTGNFAGFATTRVNRGSHYSTSTGRFTAPIAGVYRFVFAALYRRLAGSTAGEISISINGTNVNSRGLAYAMNNTTDAHTPTFAELIISLSAGDYVMPFIYSVGSGSDWYVGENLSYFCGYLLG